MALIQDTVGTLPYLITDLDQHSYEAEDCFTRFMPKAKIDTAIRPIVAPSGTKVLLANDRLVTAFETDIDKAYVPGSLVEMLKQRASGDASDAERFFEPMQKEYLDKDARLIQLAEQQIEKSIMYPGGWALFAEEFVDGVEPLYDNLESFNKWIAEDWGFGYKDTIYAPAMLSLRDLDRSVAELDRVLKAGAKFIVLPAGPAYGRSPGDPYFDPFWSRINEAKAWQWQNTYGERPITDTLSALIYDNLFGRFPDIRVLVSEYGASWIPHFLSHLDKSRGMARLGPWLGGPLKERPSTIFKNHVKVVPYPEDNTVALVDQLGGTEALVAGSDWPHAEGMREPAEQFLRVADLGDERRKHFMRDNALTLFDG
jgi:predicted TIM-barrel fold metal-dependent hydrolase